MSEPMFEKGYLCFDEIHCLIHDYEMEKILPKKCPICQAKYTEFFVYGIKYECGGYYTMKPQIQNHTDKYWGQCKFITLDQLYNSFVVAEKESRIFKTGSLFRTYLMALYESFQRFSRDGFNTQIQYILANGSEWKTPAAKKYKEIWKRLQWEKIYGMDHITKITDYFTS